MSAYDYPDYRALLAAVRAAPEDDLPRLVLADWLDEHSCPERAEFIRIQCELPRIGYQPDGTVRTGCAEDDRREFRLRRRQAELLALRGHEWGGRGILHSPAGVVRVNLAEDGDTRPVCEWSRGFVHTVRCTLEDWYGWECGCQPDDPDGRDYLRGHDCPDCHGTGRTPGVLPALVRREPVTRVEVADRKPALMGQTVTEYGWHPNDGVTEPHHLPLAVHRLLTFGGRSTGCTSCVVYPTAEAARDALSDALLQWALSNTPEDSTR